MLRSAKGGVTRAAREGRRALQRLARPAGEFDASRYFRARHVAPLGFYNVGTATVRGLARSIHAQHRDEWSIDEAMAFAEALIADRFLEVKSLGIELGWALREAGKADPVRLERCLRAKGSAVPRTTLRYAIERFSSEQRASIMQATRRERGHGR
jgi:DNA alkylation repair enzyme